MPLILERRFLPLKPLVPDEEQGGFGRTFIAEDLDFQERPLRVVKQLHPRIAVTQSQMGVIERKFQDEGNILERLSHPQIPRARAWAAVETPPDLQNQSAQQSNNQQRFFYLVQDYIDGQNLAQELRQKRRFSEDEVLEILQQLLEVLKYIHSQGVIHRDIKPSNIMRRKTDGNLYLIDFGAVKQVVVGVATEQSVVVGTPDFAPPEQLAGRAISCSSDLYSLAATCVCLLTGRYSAELRCEDKWDWRQYARVNETLADLLDRMLLFDPKHRFQSAPDVITALREPQSPPVSSNLVTVNPTDTPTEMEEVPFDEQLKRKLKRLDKHRVLGVGALVLVGLAIALVPTRINPHHPSISLNRSLNPDSPLPTLSPSYFSRGEKSLIYQDVESINPVCKQAYEKKTDGMQAFKAQDFPAARDNFQVAIDRFKSNKCSVDPETQVFLENAKANIKGNPLTTAVVVPTNAKHQFSQPAEQVLRGVAHAQYNFNQGNNNQGRLLQLIIVRDDNDKQIAKGVARYLAENKIPEDTNFKGEVLGVIGHFTSDATLAAGEVYQREKLVAVSPTSTAVRQSNPSPSGYKFNLSKYVFRTVPADSVAADRLFKYVVQKNINGGKGAIFFNSDKIYSKSLKEAFEKKFSPTKIFSCDIDESRVDQCMQHAHEQSTKFLMLALSTEDATTEKGLFAIELNGGKIPLLGGDALYNEDNLSSNFGNRASGMVVAIPTHVDLTDPWFQKESVEKLWGTKSLGWRTVTAYDAAQVIVEGLKKQGNNPTRQGLYDVLNDPKFSTQGATGTVQFDQSHDRKVNPQDHKLSALVNVCKSKNDQQYRFCLLEQ